jgi:hypothetical protein
MTDLNLMIAYRNNNNYGKYANKVIKIICQLFLSFKTLLYVS